MGILWFWVTVLNQFDRVWNFAQIRPQYDTYDMSSCCLEGIKDMSSVYKEVGRCCLLTKYATCRPCVKAHIEYHEMDALENFGMVFVSEHNST